METQSGNGEELTSGWAASRACGPQVEGEPVLREDLQAAKRIERFHIPLESLKKMFEKPAVTDTVRTAPVGEMCNCTSLSCVLPLFSSLFLPHRCMSRMLLEFQQTFLTFLTGLVSNSTVLLTVWVLLTETKPDPISLHSPQHDSLSSNLWFFHHFLDSLTVHGSLLERTLPPPPPALFFRPWRLREENSTSAGSEVGR